MLTHKGTCSLQTKRLLLRRFTEEDAADMYGNWASDERVTRYLTWRPHASERETAALLAGWVAEYIRDGFYNWAMEWEGAVIGNISVVRVQEQADACELGYCMGAAFWNRGFMTEACRAVLTFLFGEVGCNRIAASHVRQNAASGRVMQKCGMIKEGVSRQGWRLPSGQFADLVHYAVLREEWAAGRPLHL